MRLTYVLLFAAAFSLCLSNAANAGGPFDLFSNSLCCDSGCDSCCDDASTCDGGCDSGCDSCGSCETPDHYVSLFGGWSTLNSYGGEQELPPPTPQLDGTFSDGYALGIAVGRRFNNAIRGEVEFAFRSNTADKWSVNGATSDWSGHSYGYSIMGNLYHDFTTCQVGGITPYVGGGIGILIADGDFQTPAIRVKIRDEAFAYQFIAGASKSLHRSVDLFAEYRFFGSTNLSVENATAVPNSQLGNHAAEVNNLFLGIRLNL